MLFLPMGSPHLMSARVSFSRLQSLFRRVAGYAVVGFERVTFRASVCAFLRSNVTRLPASR